jgi:uncharacterized protein YoxC
MIIVYASIILVAGSLIYLAISAVKTYKDTKPALASLSETAGRMQAKTQLIKTETDKLTETQQEIAEDMEYKKEVVQYTMDSAKASPESFKQIWKAVKGKKKRHPSVRMR